MEALNRADAEGITPLLTFVLVGTVGVEIASTPTETSRVALAHDSRNINPQSAYFGLSGSAARAAYLPRSSIGASESVEAFMWTINGRP
jgi:hypothetical protein